MSFALKLLTNSLEWNDKMTINLKNLCVALVFVIIAPFQASADEVTDVVNDVAAKLVQQLPMDKKIALKSLSPDETGLPEDFLRKLTSDLEAALLTASDFEINLANRATMEDVWQEAVEVECLAEEVLLAVNNKTSVVTFSLGSGMGGDAVFSFVADVCGEASEEEKPPKHAHAFGDVGRLHKQIHEERVAALGQFHREVADGNFPYAPTNIGMKPGEKEKFLDALDGWTPTHQ